MSALPRPEPGVPPLEAGDTLTRDEFHRRYLAHPEIHKAELIEGVVYVPSPVSLDHSDPHAYLIMWLGPYIALHPEIRVSDNVTLRVPGENEVQPDVALRRENGNAIMGIDRFLHGVPDLVMEVSASSATYDTHAKKDFYRRIGVREYIVWRTFERAIDWFVLRDGVYVPNEPDAAGVIESIQFAGLRLPVQAMLDGDMAAILAAVLPAK